MGVLTFVFTRIFPSNQRAFPVFLLCGLVPYNFFSFAWGSGTQSIVDSTPFVKRVAIPREIIPIASVLSNCLHLLIQIALLLFVALIYKNPINIHWTLAAGYLGILHRLCQRPGDDHLFHQRVYPGCLRYLVESFNAVLFWLVAGFLLFHYHSAPVQGDLRFEPRSGNG